MSDIDFSKVRNDSCSSQPFLVLFVPIQESGTPNPILQNTDIQLEEKLNYQNLN
jgi:hypothetical protein